MGNNRGRVPIVWKGYDTETFKGYVKILCASDGQCIEPNVEEYTVQLLNWLWSKGDGFFFNIEYDLAAILKPWILKNRKNVDKDKYDYVIGDFQVRHYPNKAFSIKNLKLRRERARWYFDVANFFTINFTYRSLDEVAKEFLHETKNAEELGIDRAKIGEEKGYYEKHRETIRKYCINDAVLTEKLARELSNILSNLGFPQPNRWFSKASISKSFLKTIWTNKREPRFIRSIAKQSYRGGIFQTYFLGHFGHVYDMDINSAYPYAMSLLREPEKRYFLLDSELDLEDTVKRLTGLTVSEMLASLLSNNANSVNKLLEKLTNFYGFVKIELKDFSKYGFRKKKGSSIFYGKVKEAQEQWVTFYDYLVQRLFGIEYKFKGAVIIPVKKSFAFPFVQKLFDMKDKIKKEYGKSSMQYWLIKVIINALYGALAQHKPHETQFTNYLYASNITAITRFIVRSMEFMIEGVGGKVIAISTDGLVATKIPHVKASDELGKWTIEEWEEYVHYMNGIYFYKKDGKWKAKARGLGSVDPTILQNLNDVIYHAVLRKPTKIRTALRQENRNPAEFELEIRTLDPITFYTNLGYRLKETDWSIRDFWRKRQKLES